jgi:radical SAM superfamily enzyme YgiQ (UPF0313 family)
MKPSPPLGLLSLSAWLKTRGRGVEVYDSTFPSRDELLARLRADRGVLGVYTNLMTRPAVLAIVAEAKRHGWQVVLGGPESANYPAEYLAAGADVVVIGEGEITLEELLPALRSAGPHRLWNVRGVAFRDEEGRLVHTPERPKIPDLDLLPFPDRAASSSRLPNVLS